MTQAEERYLTSVPRTLHNIERGIERLSEQLEAIAEIMKIVYKPQNEKEA